MTLDPSKVIRFPHLSRPFRTIPLKTLTASQEMHLARQSVWATSPLKIRSSYHYTCSAAAPCLSRITVRCCPIELSNGLSNTTYAHMHIICSAIGLRLTHIPGGSNKKNGPADSEAVIYTDIRIILFRSPATLRRWQRGRTAAVCDRAASAAPRGESQSRRLRA